MQLDEYSQKALATLTNQYHYGQIDAQLMGQVLGLGGEAGEVQEKFKKLLRDKRGELTPGDVAAIIKELGDVLWYVTSIAHLLVSSLEEVAQVNNAKLASRRQRQVLGGSGDER